MKIQIQKWGNSLGIRLPMKLLKQLSLEQGSVVQIVVEDGHFRVYPQKYSLATMLDAITEDNLHEVQSNDATQGHEEW